MTFETLKSEFRSQAALYNALRDIRGSKRTWAHRASSTTSFLANPLHYALAQGLGVFFGSSDKTIIGSAVHAAVDFGYVNPSARLGLCIRALVKEVDEEMKSLKADLVGKITATELTKEAVRVFKVYYKEVLIHNRTSFVASEEYLEIDVPVEMYRNPENFGRVKLTGTFDRLYKNEHGEFILGDLKTSANSISGSVEKSQELQDLEAEIGSLQTEIKPLEKVASKFANAESKIDELLGEIQETTHRLKDAQANGKATKAIENKLEKLESELAKWNQNNNDREAALEEIEVIQSSLDALAVQIQPLADEYAIAKAKADLEACKTQHGFQLSLYSLMYMIVHGVEIKRVRLENVVKQKTVRIQIFEWELDDRTLAKAEEAIQMVISTIEAFYDGVDPMILFRPNPYTFYGSETNELLASFGGVQ